MHPGEARLSQKEKTGECTPAADLRPHDVPIAWFVVAQLLLLPALAAASKMGRWSPL